MNIFKKIFNILVDPRLFFRYQNYNVRLTYYLFVKILLFPMIIGRKRLIKKLKPFELLNKISKKKGYEFYDNKDIINLTSSAIKEAEYFYKNRNFRRSKKKYFFSLFEKNEITQNSKILELAKNKNILNAVSNYLGIFPVLTNISLWYTPKNKSQMMTESQLFHLDHEDFKQVKCFVYCNNVNKTSGPLMIINKLKSIKTQLKINYKMNNHSKRILDEKKYFSENDIFHFIGKKGSMVLVDTSSCFHCGGRSISGDRLMLSFQYITPYAFVKNLYKKRLFKGILNNSDIFERNLSRF
mgnify:CR=1 FL=1